MTVMKILRSQSILRNAWFVIYIILVGSSQSSGQQTGPLFFDNEASWQAFTFQQEPDWIVGFEGNIGQREIGDDFRNNPEIMLDENGVERFSMRGTNFNDLLFNVVQRENRCPNEQSDPCAVLIVTNSNTVNLDIEAMSETPVQAWGGTFRDANDGTGAVAIQLKLIFEDGDDSISDIIPFRGVGFFGFVSTKPVNRIDFILGGSFPSLGIFSLDDVRAVERIIESSMPTNMPSVTPSASPQPSSFPSAEPEDQPPSLFDLIFSFITCGLIL